MTLREGTSYRNLLSGDRVTIKRIDGIRLSILNHNTGERTWTEASDFEATHRELELKAA